MNIDFVHICISCKNQAGKEGDYFYCFKCINEKYIELGGAGKKCTNPNCPPEPDRGHDCDSRAWLGKGVDYNIDLEGNICLRDRCFACHTADIRMSTIFDKLNAYRRRIVDLEGRVSRLRYAKICQETSSSGPPRKRRRL